MTMDARGVNRLTKKQRAERREYEAQLAEERQAHFKAKKDAAIYSRQAALHGWVRPQEGKPATGRAAEIRGIDWSGTSRK